MNVLVTGASGWIGTAVVGELLDHGHQVCGLARSDAAARRVEVLGAEAVRGDLTETDVLARLAAASDGVVHLAFQHDVAWRGNFADAARADRRAVEALGGALAGSGRPLVLASGVMGLAPGRIATEQDGLVPLTAIRENPAGYRAATALYALSLRGLDVRSSVMRLPPTVHGQGDHGFVATLVDVARRRGVSGYVGDGTNRWTATHRSDVATLTRQALEDAPAGEVLHAVAEEGVAFRDVAEAIGRQLNIPTVSLSPQQALEHFAHLGTFVGLDSPASSAATRALLDWTPTGPTLIEDLDAGRYTP